METDLHLLQRYHRHGDAEAFQSLVEAHAGMVHATACRVTRDAMLAQDVAQETFLALARGSGAAIQSVGAWLHHVAWQKALNVVRGESRRRSHEAAAAHLNNPSAEAAWAELEPLLDEALAELPEPMRALIVERCLAGRTQQDLAARMGVSQSTVSRQLDAAIHELRARLRMKGAFCGAGLAALLGAHSAGAAPAGLAASLGKVSISGVGAGGAPAPATTTTITLITMTTTTKLLIAAAAVAIVSAPFIIQRSPAPAAIKPTAPAKAQPASRTTSHGKTDAADGKPHYRPAPVTRQVRQSVDAIIRRHKGMTKAQLQKSAELNQLMERFLAAMNTPGMQDKMSERIAALPRKNGAEGGMLRMDFELLDDARGRAWLEAAVSNEPRRIEDWILNTMDDAIFEFAFDPDLERTSNGVSLQPSTPPRKDTAAEQIQND